MHGMSEKMGMNCRCPHHMMGAIFVVLFGLTFLLQAMNVLSVGAVSYIWPSILILAGVSKMCAGMCSCCKGCGSKGGECGCGSEGCKDGHCATDQK